MINVSPRQVYPLLKGIKNLPLYRLKSMDWLEALTQEQLNYVHSVFVDFDHKEPLEQNLLKSILKPLAYSSSGSTLELYDALVLYKAALLPKVLQEGKQSFNNVNALVLGLRSDLTTPLDLSTPRKKLEAEALLGFTFGISGRGTDVLQNTYAKWHKAQYSSLSDQSLVPVITRHAARVEDLIHYYLNRSTDAEMLDILMNEDNVTALNDGLL